MQFSVGAMGAGRLLYPESCQGFEEIVEVDRVQNQFAVVEGCLDELQRHALVMELWSMSVQ